MELIRFEDFEKNYFSLRPFRQVAPPNAKSYRKKSTQRFPYVFLVKSKSHERIFDFQLSDKKARTKAVYIAKQLEESVFFGKLVGLGEDLQPVYESAGQVLLTKADPLSAEQLELWIHGLTRDLVGLSGSEADRLAMRAMGILDFEYGVADPKAIIRALDQVQSTIANPSTRYMTSQQQSIARSLQKVVGKTWRGTARLPRVRDGLSTRFGLPDREVSRLLSRHHSFWVRDRYKNISTSLSRDARQIISQGVRDGLGRDQIAKDLEKKIKGGLQQKGYWRTVAANHVTRARSYSLGATMLAAGVQFYKIEAVLDDRTTHQCVFLHGKTLPVAPAVQRAEQVMRSPDPEEVLKSQPFIQDVGDQLTVEYPGGSKKVVANIVSRSTGIGPRGPTASFSNGMNQAQLVDAAVGFPPYHHGCRTTVVAM